MARPTVRTITWTLCCLATFEALHLSQVQCSTVTDTHYVAAVVEYSPKEPMQGSQKLTPEENLMENIAAAGEFMAEAKNQKVDIIVFPEAGLIGLGNVPFHTLVPSPDEKVIPCRAPEKSSKPLRELSCLALNYKMYLAVNLNEKFPCKPEDKGCPEGGFFHFNTEVVFDRTGLIVARYRKYNLFGEYGNNVPPTVEYSIFETDFGVRFGMFICFDILFHKPSMQLVQDMNVTDIIFSAAWFSEVPFLTAVQAHSGWAHALDVTVLASCINYPPAGSTGSGVYRGRHGILNSTTNWHTESTMMVQRVPKAGHWDDEEVPPRMDLINPVLNYGAGKDPYADMHHLKMIQDNMTMYTTLMLPRPDVGVHMETKQTLCNNKHCCTFELEAAGYNSYVVPSAAASIHGYSRRSPVVSNQPEAAEKFDGFYYRLMVFSGVRDHSHVASTGVQVCGVVSCLSEELNSCGWIAPHLDLPTIKWTEFLSIRITSDFERDGTLQIPSTLAGPRYYPLPTNMYTFDSTPAEAKAGQVPKQTLSLQLKHSLFDLRTFAIYGRYFAWDGTTPTGYPPNPPSLSPTEVIGMK